jgi:YaiO family outer membrane protein
MKIIRLRILALLLLSISALAQIDTTAELQNGLALKKARHLPEAATAFRAVLASDPNNLEAIVQLATVESWQKHYDESIRLWEKALAAKPHDADYRIGLARVDYWSGDFGRANRELQRVLEEFPKYPDALVLMGDVQLAQERPADARRFYLRAQSEDSNYPDLTTKIARAIAPLHWRYDSGFAAEHFTGVRNNEQTTYEQLGYSFNRKSTAWIRHEYLNRFDRLDNTIGFGGSYVVAKPVVLLAEIFLTPKNDFEPDWKLHLGGEYMINTRLSLTGDYRHSSYNAGGVDTYTPGFRTQLSSWLAFNFKYNISHNLDNTITGAYQVRSDFQINERTLFYAGYARGTEDIPPLASAFLVVYSTGAVWNTTRRLGLRVDYSYEHRRNFYNHQSLGPGIRLSF